MMTMTSKASAITTMNPPIKFSVSVLLGAHKDCEPFDPIDFAALAARQRLGADVAGVPRRPAHFGLAHGIDADLVDGHGGFADQAVNVVAWPALGQAQQFFAEQP